MSSRINNLRAKIKERTSQLGIEPAHNSTGHWYRYQNKLYPSVTKKLSIIKDEGLMNWKMNRALEYVAQELQRMDSFTHNHLHGGISLIEQAKLAPQQEFEGAGDIGSAVHGWRELWFNNWILNEENEHGIMPPITDDRPEVKASCEAIKRCITKLQAQPLACELYLADEKLEIGGTLDDIWAVPVDTKEEYIPADNGDPLKGGHRLRRKWETWLVDLKTSNIGNKDSYYMQVALYWHMFRKLYKIKIDKVFILHTSKTRFGEYDLIPVKDPKRYLKMAKNALSLYDDLQELRELKKPEIAKI